jgi:hypothetical protein
MYPLSIVVLNWNLPDDTIACVDSVREAMPADATIVVVDNHSADDSVERIRAACGDAVVIIEMPANRGFAGGMNAGICYALQQGAQSVLLLNNDTILDQAMIRRMLQAASEHPAAALLGPAIYYHHQPQVLWRCADNEHPLLPVPVRLSSRALARAEGRPVRVDYITGCAMLVRREVFETSGLLDPRYVMYFEDADFCRRARRDGFQVWCVPQARMWHKVSASARTDKPRTRYSQAWGRAHFYRQHPHGIVPGLVVFYLLLKLLRTTAEDMARREWHLIGPLWRGTVRGYMGAAAEEPAS